MSAITQRTLTKRTIVPFDVAVDLLDISAKTEVLGWEFEVWPNVSVQQYRVKNVTNDFVAAASIQFEKAGFLLIDATNFLRSDSLDDAAAALTLLSTMAGTPLRIFSRGPHWRKVGVDLARPPNRSGGVGLLPLHMDFVNAERPPDVVCQFCVRPDPNKGGTTTLADLRGIEDIVGPITSAALSLPLYRDGHVVGLDGVGSDINPFCVLNKGADFSYRYTGHLLDSTKDLAGYSAIAELSDKMRTRTFRVMLRTGDLLLLDQHRIVHGREPLGRCQQDLPPESRREIMLSFLRK